MVVVYLTRSATRFPSIFENRIACKREHLISDIVGNTICLMRFTTMEVHTIVYIPWPFTKPEVKGSARHVRPPLRAPPRPVHSMDFMTHTQSHQQ